MPERAAIRVVSQRERATLRQLAEKTDPRLLGFRNAEEVARAEFGEPIRHVMIPLDRLKTYEPSRMNPESILISTGRVTVPLLLDGVGRSSMTLEKANEQWKAVAYGAPVYSREISTLRSELAEREDRGEADFIEVQVPALNLVFLGIYRDDDLWLSPLLNDARFSLRQGEILTIDDVLQRLVPAARAHNGLPS